MQSKLFIPALSCLVLLSFTCKKNLAPAPGGHKVLYEWEKFSMGVDLSYVNQVEDHGGIYQDSGKRKDPFRIMKDHGANTVRVRLWHTPVWVGKLNKGKLYYDLHGTERTMRRAKENGMAVNLDIHYSDRWADPAHQETPAAWTGLPLSVLKDSVYNYTLTVLNYFKSKDLVPEMLQVGNEMNSGMLWPVGKVEKDNWQNFAALLNSGIRAVRDFSMNSPIKPKIILHVAQLQNAEYWMKGITGNGVVDFDILGISHYAKWSAVGTMEEVEIRIRDFKTTFRKEVMIVETAYPWTGANGDHYTNIISATDKATGYDITPQEQFRYMKDLTQSIMRAGGTGIMYWEPAWITSKLDDGWGIGSSWENNAFFDFHGNALPVIDYMSYPYKGL